MRLLLTNDDGYHAQGLQALATALKQSGHAVWIVAPAENQSGKSCSLTLDRPLAATEHSASNYSINGTPADCIHIALTGLASVDAFDAVISGINDGANTGDDAIHSGTLSAAVQANMYGLPALAVSLIDRGWAHLDTAVAITQTVLAKLITQPTPALWNLNVPNVAHCHSIQWTNIGRRTASHPVSAFLSPKGERYFWLGKGGDTLPVADNDMATVAQNIASLSPVTLDRTDYATLKQMTQYGRSF